MERIKVATVTPTIQAAAYASGNSIGGLLTFSNLNERGFSAIYSATIIDKAGQNVPCDLVLFSQSITAPTDKAAVAISSADLLKAIGVISFVAGDYASCGTGSVAGKTGHVGMFLGSVSDGGDTNLYGVLVARGAATYASTSDITVKLFAEQGIL